MSFLDEIEHDPLTLAQAAKKVPGRTKNPSTLWRWARHGRQINGQLVKLEVLQVGRDLLTSRGAMLRFYCRCTAARNLDCQSPEGANVDEQVADDLAEAGI